MEIDCDPFYSSGYRHHNRQPVTRGIKRFFFVKNIYLSGKKNNNISFIIDDDDYGFIVKIKWYLHSSGYVKSSMGYLHHLIIGKPSTGYEVDHINLNKLDNQRLNLRFLSVKENRKNKSTYKTSSKFPKFAHKHGNRFQSQVVINKRTIYLGTFDNQCQAHEAGVAYKKSLIMNKADSQPPFPE